MSIPVFIHRWFPAIGENWAFDASIKDQFPALRDRLKGQAIGDPGRIEPIEAPEHGYVLVGIREKDPDSPADRFGRPICVLKVAVVNYRPSESEVHALESALQSCTMPDRPGATECLEIADVMTPVAAPVTEETPPVSPDPGNAAGTIESRGQTVRAVSVFARIRRAMAFAILVAGGLAAAWKYLQSAHSPQQVLPSRESGESVAADSTTEDNHPGPSHEQSPPIHQKQPSPIERGFEVAIASAGNYKEMRDIITGQPEAGPEAAQYTKYIRKHPDQAVRCIAKRSRELFSQRKITLDDPSADRRSLIAALAEDCADLREMTTSFAHLGNGSKKWTTARKGLDELADEYEALREAILIKPVREAYVALCAQFRSVKGALQTDRDLGRVSGDFSIERGRLLDAISAFQKARKSYDTARSPRFQQQRNDAQGDLLKTCDKTLRDWLKKLESPEEWNLQVTSDRPPSKVILIREVDGKPASIELAPAGNGITFRLPDPTDVELCYQRSLNFMVVVDGGREHQLTLDTGTGKSVGDPGAQISCPDIAFPNLPKPDDLFPESR